MLPVVRWDSLHHRCSYRLHAFTEAGEEAKVIQWHRSNSYLRSAQALGGQGAGAASSLGNPLVFSDACVESSLFCFCFEYVSSSSVYKMMN